MNILKKLAFWKRDVASGREVEALIKDAGRYRVLRKHMNQSLECDPGHIWYLDDRVPTDPPSFELEFDAALDSFISQLPREEWPFRWAAGTHAVVKKDEE